jgi:hypothetical protein
MDKLSLDDSSTIQAIGILADVLEEVSAPGALETVLVSKALRQVVATRSAPALEFASRAFNTLDPELRRRVAADADKSAAVAVDLRSRVGGFLSTLPKRPETTRERTQATNFLTALNQRRQRTAD